MTLFILFLILFSIFFTFDNKPINLLLDFIGIILSISFYLISYDVGNHINLIDFSFFSFIFIIIYGSALAILFAFIIMLFSNNNHSFNIINMNMNSNSSHFFSIMIYPLKFLFSSNVVSRSFFSNNYIYLFINHYESIFFSFFKFYFFPFFFLFFFSFSFYSFYSSMFVSPPFFLSHDYEVSYDITHIFYNNFHYPISPFPVDFLFLFFSSFIFNHIPLILIINILLLGLIGAVFLLIS